MNLDPKAGPQRLTASAVVSNMERERLPADYMATRMRTKLAHLLAATLVADALVKTQRTYDTLYQLDLYVLTSEQLSRLIEKRAVDISRGAPVRVELLFP